VLVFDVKNTSVLLLGNPPNFLVPPKNAKCVSNNSNSNMFSPQPHSKCTFSNRIAAAAEAGIARCSQLSSPRPGQAVL
jgi:hypothetical protein